MIPELQTKSTPRDVFLHLLMIVTLYVSVISFIALLFQYITLGFPDPLVSYWQGVYDTIRWSSASLVVLVPVFLWISHILEKDFHNPEKPREARIRKWLLYLTLFVAAVTILIDLVRLVYNFYSGELTAKFALNIVVVLGSAAAVFGYYFWELHRGLKPSRMPRIAAIAMVAVVLTILVAGFFIAGTPAEQRRRRLDEERTNHLQSIQSEIITYWTQKRALPATLSNLTNSISGFTPPVDPETRDFYEYSIRDPLNFELCAIFQAPSLERSSNPPVARPNYPYGPKGAYGDNWDHGQGRTCFTRTIDPQLYPPVPPVSLP